jgi:hypothetical protein
MPIRKAKKGRGGDVLAKEIAKRWVDEYKLAAMQEDGILWCDVTYGDKVEAIPLCNANDPKPLLELLENFAETGFFEPSERDEFREVKLSQLLNEYKDNLKTKKRIRAVSDMSEKWSESEKSILRHITEAKKLRPKK